MAQKTTTRETRDLHDWCRARLSEHGAAAFRDPLANGVRRLALDILDRVEKRDIDVAGLCALSKSISDKALIERARRLLAKSPAENWDGCVAKALRPFDGMGAAAARKRLEAPQAGVVFTAHPTFALSRRLRAAAIAAADGSDAALAGIAHAPDKEISLEAEHEDALTAIGRAQDALRDLSGAVVDWLAQRFPTDWQAIAPAPLSLATWIGYDLDGRTDIHWGQTFRIRLKEKSLQLRRYATTLAGLGGSAGASLAARLAAAADEAGAQAALFAADLDDPQAVVAAANRLTADSPARLVSLEDALAEIGRLIAASADIAEKKALVVLRGEMRNYGLGVARIHLRVNAAQVRSAVKADLGLDMGREFLDRTALAAAAEKSAHVATQALNFGSVFVEKMTARRQLMLAAQLLKHVDADGPIRFLIAEVEAPATIMAAVYLARLYGVDKRLDISPLFETPDALERGGRFMERPSMRTSSSPMQGGAGASRSSSAFPTADDSWARSPRRWRSSASTSCYRARSPRGASRMSTSSFSTPMANRWAAAAIQARSRIALTI
jgi:phosphoenolpyruvate carboxylase